MSKTVDIKELVKRLQRIQVGMANEEEDAVLAAIGALEAMTGERDRLKAALEDAVRWMNGCAVSGDYPAWHTKARKALAGETT